MRKFKYWLLNVFCKNELSAMQDCYSRKVRDIEYDANKKNQNMDIVHRILTEKNHFIVGEADNKNREHVFVVQWTYNNSINFQLYSNCYKAINNHPRIMATYNNYYDGNPFVKIDDIIVEDNNVGNGSILMPYFLDYCKKYTDARYISGELSSVDSGHFDRSEHFYKKHGYEVIFNERRTSGSIKYNIK